MKKVTISSPYKNIPDVLHKAVVIPWSSCTDCGLCNGRTNIVFFRGSCPCDVLFIDGSPGKDEDLSGSPLVGHSGQLLDRWIEDVTKETKKFSYGVTSIVSCIPTETDERTGKVSVRVPSKIEAEACRLRLHTTIDRCRPSLIVLLGKTAKKYLRIPKSMGVYNTFELQHPNFVLKRGGIESLEYRKNLIYLREAIGGIK